MSTSCGGEEPGRWLEAPGAACAVHSLSSTPDTLAPVLGVARRPNG